MEMIAVPTELSAKRRAAALARKTRSGGRNGGRPLSRKARCPCGAMTARRAKARGHRCVASADQSGTGPAPANTPANT